MMQGSVLLLFAQVVLSMGNHEEMSQGSCAVALPQGSKGSKCSKKDCAHGLECFNGVCLTNLFSADTDCVDKNALCLTLISHLNIILQGWHLIVTSSGGGGHLAAARNLEENLSTRLDSDFQATLKSLGERKTWLTQEAYGRADAALVDAQGSKKPIVMLDMMGSKCTSLDGHGVVQMGEWMTKQWNDKQRVGDIPALKKLVKKQFLTQYTFGIQCTRYFESVLSGSEHDYRQPPQSLYSTQPLLLQSIVQAANKIKLRVDLFMTDLPTEEAVHFFDPLGEITRAVDVSRLFVHTLAPVNGGGRDALHGMCGLPADQFVLEPFMPVNRAFTEPNGLPAPKERTKIKLKPQLPIERRFLEQFGKGDEVEVVIEKGDEVEEVIEKGDEAEVVIEKGDEVMLIMLGSQPTVAAMQQYAEEVLKLPPPEQGVRYVFLACGKPTVPEYAELYSKIVSMATESKKVSKNVMLVPFTGQDAKMLLGRADIAVTRSGGMTAGELLALRSRAQDDKRLLLHVEPVDDTAATRALARYQDQGSEGDDEESLQAKAWEEVALNDGMVSWEAGNARYLMKELNAEIVTPERIVQVVSGDGKKKYFEVQWGVLLPHLGFRKDAVAFSLAHAQDDVCSALTAIECPRSITAAPLRLNDISISTECQTALASFERPYKEIAKEVAASKVGQLAASKVQSKMKPGDVLSNSLRCESEALVVPLVVRNLVTASVSRTYIWGRTQLLKKTAKAAAAACGMESLICGDFLVLRYVKNTDE